MKGSIRPLIFMAGVNKAVVLHQIIIFHLH